MTDQRKVIYHESHPFGEEFEQRLPAPRVLSIGLRWKWAGRWHDLDIVL